ncbi:primosomal protein N', partial [Chamaesiphon sp. VAR_48_metabat_403]|uniref:replication restart helicase PriA n=1 Tax=Chamaesiphon sp. VAR_48_metabat_403 TaxID=2964700 RepID=UPI00286DE391
MLYPDLSVPSMVSEPITGYALGDRAAGLVEVLVDCPGTQALYTYNVPERLKIRVGDILSVPLGGQVVGGIAIRFVDRLPENLAIDKIKDIDDVVASGLFKANYWQWLEQIADYYYTPLIQVIKVALPPGLLTRSHRRIRSIYLDANSDVFLGDIAKKILDLLNSQSARNYSWQHIQKQIPQARRGLRELLDKNLVESYLESGKTQQPKLQKAVVLTSELFGNDLTERQRSIVEILKQHQGELWQSDLLKLIDTKSSSILKGIAEKGYIAIVNKEKLRSEPGVDGLEREPAKQLTPDQAAALAVINELSGFAQVLLHGVTGSGKTEVYLQAIAKIIARQQSVLVLVPEIGLTPQLTDRFRSRFGDKVGVYHSALSDGERYDTWRQMLNQTNPIIIGTRSAIFAPLPNLGLIILDEEHDSSFKQDQPAPTYQTRDIANWRARLESCPLILGSATPSLETWVSARETGRLRDGGTGRQGD